MPGISGLNGSTTLQPTMNVDELLNSQKTDDTKKTESPSDVGKTDKTGAKTELEEVVHDDTALNGQTAENFVKANTVEVPGNGGATPFEKAHPKLALAAQIVEMIIVAVEAAMSQVADKLPNGIGKYITGGLGVLKGVCGLHRCKDLESASKALSEQVGASAKAIAEGIWGKKEEENDGKLKVGNLAVGGGKAIFGLVTAFTSDNPENAMKIAVDGAATLCEGLNGRFGLTPNVCKQIKGAADKVSTAAPNVVKGIKGLFAKTSKVVDKGLEDFEEAVQENKDIPAESKAFVKKLIAGTREAVKKDGYKKALETYTGTIGSLLSDGLNAKEKKVFDETISLIGDIAAEKDPVKAYKLVLARAKSLAGGESEAIDKLAETANDKAKLEGLE